VWQFRFGGILALGKVSICWVQCGKADPQDCFTCLGNRVRDIGQVKVLDACEGIDEPRAHEEILEAEAKRPKRKIPTSAYA
jgi:hypothetical protein